MKNFHPKRHYGHEMQHVFFLVLFLISNFWTSSVQGASKYYDGDVRPYEFGYNLEGNQHRHEMKDENGIIMGEFGFITADGVYHVTAYATDENGNFKILFMKNIKIGLPGEQKKSAALSGSNVESQPTSTYMPPPPVTKAPRRRPSNSEKVSCSSCVVPKTDEEEDREAEVAGQISTGGGVQQQYEKDSTYPNRGGNSGRTKGGAQIPGSPGGAGGAGGVGGIGGAGASGSFTDDNSLDDNNESSGAGEFDTRFSSKGPKPPLKGGPSSQSRRPSGEAGTVNAGNAPNIGSYKAGVAGSDQFEIGPLYKFNYTVGYHQHHEEGDTAGAKDGGYYFVGRDGYKRVIDYQANEFGYQPYLKLEEVDQKDVPKPETEKEAGLKGYEFKWFNKKAR